MADKKTMLEEIIKNAQAELDALNKPVPKFPIKTKFYSHSDKDSNWNQAEELGFDLNSDAARNFAYTGLEIVFDIEVDEQGNAFATAVNGTEIQRVAI